MTIPDSLAGLASLRAEEAGALLRGVFEVELVTAAEIQMSERGWKDAYAAMRAPRETIERQKLVLTRDLALGAEAVSNCLRARRIAAAAGGGPVTAMPDPAAGRARTCAWCDREVLHVARHDLSVDGFGAVYAAEGRVRAGPNWARQAPVSGVVFGDHDMHDLLALSRADFRALFEAAEGYIRRASWSLPEVRHFEVFINGGARSAASVPHAHAQVVGRGERHFAYPHGIAARAPETYWDTARGVHEDLGLASDFEGGIAWASLVPMKERDITAFSGNLPDGADMIHAILQALMRHGTNSYSLAAILAPDYATGARPGGRYRHWPPVLWRLLDRGDAGQRHSDFGCLELFGTSVVATDPFTTARWVAEAARAAAGI